jgi:RND family efflux transporter MFP subunit
MTERTDKRMNRTLTTLLIAALAAAAMAAGYWWGSTQKAEGGRRSAEGQPASAAKDPEKGKVLYYRNPMGLPDTSPVPKKDPMGMDYIPVREGEDVQAGPSGSEIRISAEKVQMLGVRTEPAAFRSLGRTVRAVGTLQVDERRIHTVAPRFEGWIERLHVNTTGQAVARGQPLMEVYSPDLVTAQQEYLVAAKGLETVAEGGPEAQASLRRLMEGALQRMRNWDISDRELQQLQREGAIRRTVTIRAPVGGIVVEKPAVAGMRFMPGEMLYQITDLSVLWLIAEVFEQDMGLVRPGQSASISVNAYPGKPFTGKVAFFYPTVTAETRTARLRIELANPGALLKPNMYATVELAAGPARKVLAVPESAVIDGGVRRIVLVQAAEGRFQSRDVKLGARAEDYVEILDGVKDGEAVVVSANFLIDAESNLRAAIGGLSPAPAGGASTGAKPPASPVHRAEGTIDSVDAASNSVTITHGPVPSLKWPGMTMDFSLANTAVGAKARPGAAIAFEFVERQPGEYVVTKMEPKAAPKPAPSRPDHSGH